MLQVVGISRDKHPEVLHNAKTDAKKLFFEYRQMFTNVFFFNSEKIVS